MSAQDHPISVRQNQWAIEDLALICGIANAGGGKLIIDSNSRSYTSGLRKMRRPFEQIPRLASSELGLNCSTEPIIDGSLLFLEIDVPDAEEPISYDGHYWYYDGERNIKSSKRAIEKLRSHAATGGTASSWEMRQQPDAQEKDLNAGEVLTIISMETGIPDLSTDSLDAVLDRRLSFLNLKDHRTRNLTNAGVLLLHNDPQQFIPGSWVQLQLYAQSENAMLQNEVKGPLAHQLKESMRLLFEQYMPMALITPGISDDSAIAFSFPPRETLQEVLLDALAHKDYQNESPVRISVYPDRVIIESPRFPESSAVGQTMGSWAQDGKPFGFASSSNPVIVNAMRLMGVMGDGDLSQERLSAQCVEVGLDAPLLQQDSDQMSVVFSLKSNSLDKNEELPPPESTRPLVAENPEHPESVSQNEPGSIKTDSEVDPLYPKTSNTFAEEGSKDSISANRISIKGLKANIPKDAPFTERSIAAANNLDLTSTDEYVLRVLHTNGRATAVRIASVLGVSESTVRRSFRRLRENGIIARVGSDKAGYWRVLD